VTYSVCAEDVGPYDPQWRLSTGCRLMVLHLDAPEQPQPLPAADAPGTSVTTPSMWRGNLVFSRHADGGDTSEVLYLPRGASAPVSLPVPVRPCESECEIAVARTTIVSRQEGGATTGIGPEWTLRVAPLDGSKPHDLSTGFIDGACGFIMPVSPTADGIGAFWDATGSACETTETVFAEHHVRTKRRREAQDPDHEVWTAARDATATYWLRGARGKARFHAPDQRACTLANAECVLVRAPRLRWRTLKPGEILGPHPEEY
jgi:hypothetical protein